MRTRSKTSRLDWPLLNSLVTLGNHFGWQSMSAGIAKAHYGLVSDGKLVAALALSWRVLDSSAGELPPYCSTQSLGVNMIQC